MVGATRINFMCTSSPCSNSLSVQSRLSQVPPNRTTLLQQQAQ